MRHQSLARWGALAVAIAVSLTSGTVIGQSAQAERPQTRRPTRTRRRAQQTANRIFRACGISAP